MKCNNPLAHLALFAVLLVMSTQSALADTALTYVQINGTVTSDVISDLDGVDIKICPSSLFTNGECPESAANFNWADADLDGSYSLGFLGAGTWLPGDYTITYGYLGDSNYDPACNASGTSQVISIASDGTYSVPDFNFANDVDVAVAKISNPASAKLKNKIPVQVTVSNVGDTAIATPFKVGVYLLKKGTFSLDSGTKLTTYKLSGLAVGGKNNKKLQITIPSKVKAGKYYFGVIANIQPRNLYECQTNESFDPSWPADNDFLVSAKKITLNN